MGRRRLHRGIAALLLLLAAGATRAAGAATITSLSSVILPGGSTGTIGPVGSTPAPNDDNATTASANVVPASIFFNAFGVAELEFALASSGGTTEYRVTPNLVNNTGVSWSGFRFELGFGTGAGFVPSGLLDLLDFDTPDRDPAPTSSGFATLDHQPNELRWGGGTVPSVGPVAFTFAIDVPDGLAELHPLGLNRFTLRLAPVPEPATLGLLGIGLAALSGVRRRAR